MKTKILTVLCTLAVIVQSSCKTTGDGSEPALGYTFESDTAAHVFYQGILDRTSLPLQTKTKYIDTPILVVQKVSQISGASIAREAAARADADKNLENTESEARAFAKLGD